MKSWFKIGFKGAREIPIGMTGHGEPVEPLIAGMMGIIEEVPQGRMK
jgi:hypothetical protein